MNSIKKFIAFTPFYKRTTRHKMKMHFNQINLKTLSTLEDVDKNTVAICGQNGLLDLGKIIEYYLKNSNF